MSENTPISGLPSAKGALALKTHQMSMRFGSLRR